MLNRIIIDIMHSKRVELWTEALSMLVSFVVGKGKKDSENSHRRCVPFVRLTLNPFKLFIVKWNCIEFDCTAAVRRERSHERAKIIQMTLATDAFLFL